eukprot:SAG31_NODE_826_length_11751_cov_4.887659_12_plen_269_part_00
MPPNSDHELVGRDSLPSDIEHGPSQPRSNEQLQQLESNPSGHHQLVASEQTILLRTDSKLWHVSGLWPPPKIMRTGLEAESDYEHDRDVTWSELFFDLIYAAGIDSLSQQLRADLDNGDGTASEALGRFCFYFLLIWYYWNDVTQYGTRYGADDLFHKIYFSVYLAAVMGIIITSAGPLDDAADNGFCIACALCSALQALGYVRIAVLLKAQGQPNQTEKEIEDEKKMIEERHRPRSWCYAVFGFCSALAWILAGAVRALMVPTLLVS